MNSIQEIKDFLGTLDPGKAKFKIWQDYGSLIMQLDDWDAKTTWLTSSPIEEHVHNALHRSFSKETRKMTVNIEDAISSLPTFIYEKVIDLAEETSPVSQPKRTNMYKEIVLLARTNCREEVFINDMLPVINYYYKAKTDSNNNEMDMVVHKNNVQALFNVLRKKHGSKKNM